jgi:two-component system cell cycle response regulator CpdR
MHKILLAEDDNDMRRFLVKALENAGFQVSPHDNGLSAYQRLREEPFEMLLTDIVMPEMDGIELARRASELDPDIKIMFITGFAAVALNSDSEAPKNAKVLSKPVHLARIGQRSEQDAGGLIPAGPAPQTNIAAGQASLPARFGADIRTPPVT